MHESESNDSEVRATCVDEPNNVVDDDDVNDVDGAPLASMESDPAPLASLESSTTAEMPSMWLFVRLYNYYVWCMNEFDSFKMKWYDFMHFCKVRIDYK